MREIVDDVLEMLTADREFALVTVVRQSGSTPRAAGAQMLVRPDGSIAGTIGGGLLEATMMQEAERALKRQCSVVTGMALTGRSVEGPCMVCGGNAEVLVAYVSPGNPELLDVCSALTETLRQQRRGWLFTFFAAQPGESEVEYSFLCDDGEVAGRAPNAADDLRQLVGKSHVHGSAQLADGREAYVEPVDPPSVAVICGAGHVAQALAPVAAAVGFEVVVLDDRPEFANAERFPSASRIVVLDDFDEAFERVTLGPESFVISVTRGHAHDFTVLVQALRTPAGYIGLIGSSTKRKHVFKALAEQGFGQADIDRIHTPIGISIGAETPAELAISIVAEMIRVRASGA
jgi:xanthine dehydrogenase accessory factor